MASASKIDAGLATLADVLARIATLGAVSLERIRMNPLPGTATEADVIAAREGPDKVLCDLIDGTLVEKPAEDAPGSTPLAEWLSRTRRRKKAD